MLTESIEIDDVLSQPYFKNNPKFFLYRGSSYFDEITKLEFRFRKRSVDTLDFIHNQTNDLSIEKFGLPIRNLLFCYPNIDNASSYGPVHLIVPIGNNYKMYANHMINDFTEDLSMGNRFYHKAATSVVAKIINMEFLWELSNENVTLTDTLEKILGGANFGRDNNVVEKLESILNNSIDDVIDYKVFRNEITQEQADECFIILKDNHIISSIIDKFKELYDNFLDNTLNNYINGVTELSVTDDIDDSSNSPEIMLYAPDGFYIIPRSIYNEITQ